MNPSALTAQVQVKRPRTATPNASVTRYKAQYEVARGAVAT